jgi:hypothetical protein
MWQRFELALKYGLAALGAYILVGLWVTRHGWQTALVLVLGPLLYGIYLGGPTAKPPDSPSDACTALITCRRLVYRLLVNFSRSLKAHEDHPQTSADQLLRVEMYAATRIGCI